MQCTPARVVAVSGFPATVIIACNRISASVSPLLSRSPFCGVTPGAGATFGGSGMARVSLFSGRA